MLHNITAGDRIVHATSGRAGVVLRAAGDKPWQAGEVKVLLDGASLPLDTRECFLTAEAAR